MKGRKPKPLAEHIANGTFKKSRHDKRVISPDPLGAVPPLPDYLPPECAEDWHLVCGILLAHGLLCENDLHGVEAYCALRLQYRIALKSMQNEGQVVTEVNGNGVSTEKINPAWKVMMEAAREIRAIQDRYGFNPYTRQKLSLVKNEEAPDPFSALINAKS